MRLALLLLLLSTGLFGQATEPELERELKFDWRPALLQSAAFLAIQHGTRIATEADSRHDLKGPFWRDYVHSVRGIGGWGDGDSFMTNYVGHPFQGAVSGFIEVQNDPKYMTAEFGASPRYWKSRARATAWSAVYSLQFELGPLSEASLGNVGLKPETAGVVDLVITPTGGLGMMVAEDALDRYVVQRYEKWTTNPFSRAIVRGVLNPNRSLANLLRGKLPWHRDTRPGVTVR